MNVLITGSSGFIGSHLAEELVKKGYNVKCLVRKTSNIENLKKLGVELVYGELTNKDSLARAVDDVDIVYHLGAVLGSFNEPKELIWNVNVNGTKNILDESFKHGVKKFIHFSTFLVYGYTKKPANEKTPYSAPTTYYGETKRESEKIVEEYMDKGMSTVIIQPTVIHGAGLDFGFANLFKAIQDGKFMFIGNGDNLLHLGYIDNLIEGVLLASESEKAIGKKYIIGDEKPLPFKVVVGYMAGILGVKMPRIHLPEVVARVSIPPLKILSLITAKQPILTSERINFIVKNQAGDISKIKNELGFKPRISSRDGLELTIEHYKKIGFLR